MGENAAFAIFYFCLIFGGLGAVGLVVGVIMNLVERIPFVRRRLDAWFDTLPMSDPDW